MIQGRKAEVKKGGGGVRKGVGGVGGAGTAPAASEGRGRFGLEELRRVEELRS